MALAVITTEFYLCSTIAGAEGNEAAEDINSNRPEETPLHTACTGTCTIHPDRGIRAVFTVCARYRDEDEVKTVSTDYGVHWVEI